MYSNAAATQARVGSARWSGIASLRGVECPPRSGSSPSSGPGQSDGTISDVVPRDHIYVAQAPQTFHLDEILGLYDDAVARGEHDSIDSCTLMQQSGRTLYRVDGPRSNIKITTAEDFYVCRTYFDILEVQQLVRLS